MSDQVAEDIKKKIQRERNIIIGASNMKKTTSNPEIIQKCNSNIQEAQQNIDYLNETLNQLRFKDEGLETRSKLTKSSNSPNDTNEQATYSNLDLIKSDCPSLGQRIHYMINQLDTKLKVEQKYYEANEKLSKIYRMDGDRRSSSVAEDGRIQSNHKIQLLKKAVKRYEDIHVNLDQLEQTENIENNVKFRRKPLAGTLTIGINSIRDVAHISSPMFSRKTESYISIKIDDDEKARTKGSRSDKWNEEFNIHIDRGNEVEITVFDKVGTQFVPVAVAWFLVSDIAEEIRKKKVGQTGVGWVSASKIQNGDKLRNNISSDNFASNDHSETTITHASTHSNNNNANNAHNSVMNEKARENLRSTNWFILEPSGQIMITFGFTKSTTPNRTRLLGGLHRNGAIRKRDEDVYEQHGHQFVQKQFYSIMRCALCGEFLPYNGYQCQDCKFLCHKKCYQKVITKCISKSSTDIDPDELKINHRIPHRFEHVSNRGTNWCCHCGYLLPWGRKNVLKCSECDTMCHVQCSHLVPDFCGMSMETANKILTTIKSTEISRKKFIKDHETTHSTTPSTTKSQDLTPLKEVVTNNSSTTEYQGNLLPEIQQDGFKPFEFDETILDHTPEEITEPGEISTSSTTEYNPTYDQSYNNIPSISGQKIPSKESTIGSGTTAQETTVPRSSSTNPFHNYNLNNNSIEMDQTGYGYDQQKTKYETEQQRYIKEQQIAEERRRQMLHQKSQKLPELPPSTQTQGQSSPPQLPNHLQKQKLPNLPTQQQAPPHHQQYNQVLQESQDNRQSIDSQRSKTSSGTSANGNMVVSPKANTAAQQQSSQPKQSSHHHRSAKDKRHKPKVGLDDFNFLAVLGRGNFGKVMLGRSYRTQKLCAVKVLKKDMIVENGELPSMQAEKEVFLIANKESHPFLINLHCCFQTANRIYFVMEYISGGDLMWHVQKSTFSQRRAKFYASEVLLALQYLHENGIVYRDLKLDNILLTPSGHIKIADYGLCKPGMWYGKTTNTFCGTPEFMAPEILKEESYTRAVDWWAFGVLLYQMLLGKSPFRGDDEDEVFNAILTDEPLFPIQMASEAVGLLESLLTKDPTRRLGSTERDALEVMEHAYFRNINFDDIRNLRVPPPYVPEVKADDDISYFDKDFTSEVPRLTPVNSVLDSSTQAQFRGFSYVSEESGLN